MSSVAGFSFLAALVGGGTVLGILSTIDYLYTCLLYTSDAADE